MPSHGHSCLCVSSDSTTVPGCIGKSLSHVSSTVRGTVVPPSRLETTGIEAIQLNLNTPHSVRPPEVDRDPVAW